MYTHPSGPHGLHQVNLPHHPGAATDHEQDPQQVEGAHDSQERVPEPQEDEYLLGDDVGGEQTPVVMLHHVAVASVQIEVTLCFYGKNHVQYDFASLKNICDYFKTSQFSAKNTYCSFTSDALKPFVSERVEISVQKPISKSKHDQHNKLIQDLQI